MQPTKTGAEPRSHSHGHIQSVLLLHGSEEHILLASEARTFIHPPGLGAPDLQVATWGQDRELCEASQIQIRLEAIASGLKAIALRLEHVSCKFSFAKLQSWTLDMHYHGVQLRLKP